jgi:hypothetical protein
MPWGHVTIFRPAVHLGIFTHLHTGLGPLSAVTAADYVCLCGGGKCCQLLTSYFSVTVTVKHSSRKCITSMVNYFPRFQLLNFGEIHLIQWKTVSIFLNILTQIFCKNWGYLVGSFGIFELNSRNVCQTATIISGGGGGRLPASSIVPALGPGTTLKIFLSCFT